ncbi:MAG: polysaccharide biosynthesis tyrosine autokinase [Eubacteriales bacterium]|nr:polysaccharide biosynthesis tyrosine autokinase [Eubacteriales bacterium]
MGNDRDDVQGLEQLKIEPFTLIHDILTNWWVILLGAIAAALLTYVVINVRYIPEYSTSTTFVVASKGDSNAASNLSSAYSMAQTFEKILQSNIMAKTVCEELKIDELDAEINTEVLEGTNLLVLTVTEKSPKEAIDVIRSIMDNYTSVSFYTVGNTVMDVLEEPKVPMAPDNPLDARGAMKKGFLAGAAVLILLFGILSYMKDTIKQEDEIEEKLDARNLGVIAYESKYKTVKELLRRKKGALLVNSPVAGFVFVEGYKKLATKVDYQMAKDKRKVLVVTSVSENEGKSTVAANLAITLAEQAKKVLLIEGDLRRPSQFLIFGQKPEDKNEIGEFLKGQGQINDILIKSDLPNLYLMIGRNCYSTSTEILQSERMKKLIEACRKSMDYVIIDSPPAGMMGDAEVLAGYADAVMVVVKQNYMLSEDINDALDAFRAHHSKVLGVVLNGVKSFSSTPIGGYYGGYGKYGRYGNYGKNRGNR